MKKEGGDGAYFVNRFEAGGLAQPKRKGISLHVTLDSMSSVFTLQDTLAWFDELLAALDCYCWVCGENLIQPVDIFSSKICILTIYIYL